MNSIIKIVDNIEDIQPSNFFINKKKISEIKSIMSNVKQKGDVALRNYEKKFNNVKIKNFIVSEVDIKNAYTKVTKKQIMAIKFIRSQLISTESALKRELHSIKINKNGLEIKKSFVPICSVGCYVPGGLAKYPSSLIMSVVPAKIAGVKRIVVTSPPNEDGSIDPLILVAADICGVNEFYKLGGAHSIAALTYGTQTIRAVNKIIGPGGIFVTIAKSLISNNTSIDMIAGPTELGIIVDETSDLNFVVLDMISQAEHDVNTTCFVVTTSLNIANIIVKKLNTKIQFAKRKDIVKRSITKNGFIAICKTQKQIIDLINKLSPEHLEIMTKNSHFLSSQISNAGIVLIGKYTPSSASDYVFGSNHILPTNAFGKTRGSLSVLDFVKLDTRIKSSKSSLKKLKNYVEIITNAENLPNHYNAVRDRFA
ncbi:MAG: histidinol dehydrogenase [Thaumarchaeota archaeon]|nr:histidinol dehydrogenase [Nitrososphaerota archaeon]